MRFMFVRIAAAQRVALNRGRALLLDYVGGFVRHQPQIHLALTRTQNNVGAMSKGSCGQTGCGALRARI